MRFIKLSSLLILLACTFYGFKNSVTPEKLTCKQVLDKMDASIDNVKTLTYHLKISERHKTSIKNYESRVKLQIKPRKLYINIKGIEVLWTEGTNNGKALVNPNSFPYVNLNLDPGGSLMRQDQHHSIYEMGFSYLNNVLQIARKDAGENFDKVFKLVGEEEKNYRKCYKIVINNPTYTYKEYTVLKGETVITIARKLNIPEYKILEINPKIGGYKDVDKGQVIKVPSSYAKDVTVYVDAVFFTPVSVHVVDDKGLFEEYNYMFLQYNPVIKDEEFTRNFKEYKF